MRTVALVLFVALAAFGQTRFPFMIASPSEVTATLELSSPTSDWAKAGREAAIASVSLDGKFHQHVVVYAGRERYPYKLSLGQLTPGKHELSVVRDQELSAAGSDLQAHALQTTAITTTDPTFDVMAHSPALYARLNTIGKFSDVPLILYAERFQDQTGRGIEYTVIFSNEDGGTSTRALMARWGRTTDIEYIYRYYPETGRAIVQGPGHRDLDFAGDRDREHPFLMPVTDNNMVAGAKTSALLFRPAPILADLKSASRESVMDGYPVTHQVMAKELEREGKLRPFGVVDGENISDQRNYLYVDFSSTMTEGSLAVLVRLKNSSALYASDLGRVDYAIARSGDVRTTVELPPGTTPDQISELIFECRVAPRSPLPHSGTCVLNRVNRVFKLGSDYMPTKSFLARTEATTLASGSAMAFKP